MKVPNSVMNAAMLVAQLLFIVIFIQWDFDLVSFPQFLIAATLVIGGAFFLGWLARRLRP